MPRHIPRIELKITHQTSIGIEWLVFLTQLTVNLHLLFSQSVIKCIQLRVFIPFRFHALIYNQTSSVADEGRRSEGLLYLQSIKPATQCVSTGTLWPLPDQTQKGLPTSAYCQTRAHLAPSGLTSSWVPEAEGKSGQTFFDHRHFNVSNLLAATNTAQLHLIYTVFEVFTSL